MNKPTRTLLLLTLWVALTTLVLTGDCLRYC